MMTDTAPCATSQVSVCRAASRWQTAIIGADCGRLALSLIDLPKLLLRRLSDKLSIVISVRALALIDALNLMASAHTASSTVEQGLLQILCG